MVEVVVTRDELLAQLAACCHEAKRDFPVVGTTLRPSAWDIHHARLSALLDELVGA